MAPCRIMGTTVLLKIDSRSTLFLMRSRRLCRSHGINGITTPSAKPQYSLRYSPEKKRSGPTAPQIIDADRKMWTLLREPKNKPTVRPTGRWGRALC